MNILRSPRKGIRGVLHALRLRGPLTDDRTARILHVLLVALALWMAAAWAITIPFAPISFPRVFNPLVLEASYVAALVLLRRGHFQTACLAYLGGTWMWATLTSSFYGGVYSPGALLYVSLPASAAWLLGYKAAIRTAVGCLLAALVFAVPQMAHASLPFQRLATPLGTWFMIAQAVLINAIPVGQIIGRLRETLIELQRHQQHLESLVEERTNELVLARDQAESANRAKSAFLATMNHELRTPLNAILGFSNVLRARSESEAQRRDLEIINRSGEHLLALINAVLDVAKIEAGHTVVDIAPCDVRALVRDVVELMQVRVAEKHLTLKVVDGGDAPVYARLDAAKLREVLINLLGNAVKYTDLGSITLRFEVQPVHGGEQLLLRFAVEDTGIGIAPADHERIFKPFEQLARGAHQKGTGLGLAITRQLVELMGGSIKVESTLGKGSCFGVDLVAERMQETDTGPTDTWGQGRIPILEEGQPEYRILIVEDQPENWMVLARLMTEAGFEVRVAENGEQAIETFREWRPQFIWMDLRMPVMNGIEATQRIRTLDGGRQVKIVAVTASGFENHRSDVLAAGLDDDVRKPYRLEEIFDCMARHLGVHYRSTEGAPVSGGSKGSELDREAIAALPGALLLELRSSLIALNVNRISHSVEKVAEYDAELAAVMRRHAEGFGYTTILSAIEEGTGDSTAISS